MMLMHRQLFTSLALASVLVGTAQSYDVAPADSRLMWTGARVASEHTGTLTIKSGTILMNGRDLGAADITVDMTSIVCTDITNPGSNAKLVGHLKSADFFDVENHPVATFRTTSVEGLPANSGQPNYRVTGDLTIKGITHSNTFDVLVRSNGEVVSAAANLEFDRSKYDVRYGSGSFFDGLGDKMIKDMVQLTFDLRAR
jgi:polyisoprenoid-binding protein YceI